MAGNEPRTLERRNPALENIAPFARGSIGIWEGSEGMGNMGWRKPVAFIALVPLCVAIGFLEVISHLAAWACRHLVNCGNLVADWATLPDAAEEKP